MYWTSRNLRKEEKIRERIQYHQIRLDRYRENLSNLYDKVHKENRKNEKTPSSYQETEPFIRTDCTKNS